MLSRILDSMPSGCDLVGVFANLIMSCAGAGILSFPFAIAQGGIVLGALATCLVGLLNFGTLRLLLWQSETHHHALLGKRSCYEDVVEICAGPVTARFAALVILFNQFGSAVGYQIVLLDLLCPVIMHFLRADKVDDTLIRMCITLVVAICMLWPLSLFRRIHELACVSSIAAMAVFGAAAVISWEAANAGPDVDISLMLIGSPLGICRALPLFVFAMNMHIQSVPIHAGLLASSQRLMMRSFVAPMAMFCCMVAYIVPGTLAAVQFGSDTPGDVLEAYSNADLLMAGTKCAMAIHLALGYPVVLFPMLRTLEYCNATGVSQVTDRPWRLCSFLPLPVRVAVIVCSTSLVAIFLPKVSIAFGIVGSTFGSCIIYIFPSLCTLSVHQRRGEEALLNDGAFQHRRGDVVFSLIALCFGIVVAFFGTIATIL